MHCSPKHLDTEVHISAISQTFSTLIMFSSGSCGETGRLEDWLGGLHAWNDPSALVEGMSPDLLSIPVKESVCGCEYESVLGEYACVWD